MSSLLRLERKQCMSNLHISISLFSFGTEMITMFIHSRSSLENHTQFQTKMGKVYTRFQNKTAQKPYLMGRHLPIIAYIREYPRTPLPGSDSLQSRLGNLNSTSSALCASPLTKLSDFGQSLQSGIERGMYTNRKGK